jgi:hypothetical protein
MAYSVRSSLADHARPVSRRSVPLDKNRCPANSKSIRTLSEVGAVPVRARQIAAGVEPQPFPYWRRTRLLTSLIDSIWHFAQTTFITDYSVRITAPLRCGVAVMSVRPTDEGRFVVQLGQQMMVAANVVVATGPYQLPSIPPCSRSFPCATYQVTANRYTRPSDLPPGSVLVVRSGGSGCQIVEDLRDGGRQVFYAIRRHRRWPRRYRGQDVECLVFTSLVCRARTR